MLVRDPDGLMDHLIKGVGGKKDTVVKDKTQDGTKTPPKEPKKLDKIFKMGNKEYDLSKSMGGLSQEDYDALGGVDKKRLDMRLKGYESQNYKERHAAIKGNANNIVPTKGVSNKVNGVSSSASYEEGSGKEVVIINPKNNPSTTSQPTEKGKVVAIDTGSGSEGSDSTASLYRG